MPASNDPNTKAVSPEQLVEQLFNLALIQYRNDIRETTNQVIDFLTKSLIYAVVQAKGDPIVFLTETLIRMVSSSSADEASRKELLKNIADTFAAAAAPAAAAATPAAAAAAATSAAVAAVTAGYVQPKAGKP